MLCPCSISILVKGSSTSKFNLQRMLQQGHPLALFLFMVVAEGLNGIMRMNTSKCLFSGYKVGDGSVDRKSIFFNMWTIQSLLKKLPLECDVIKSIMRWFVLASRLKVNFAKISFGVIDMELEVGEALARMLNCKVL